MERFSSVCQMKVVPIDTKIAVSPAACALQLKMVPRFLLETLKE